MKIRVTNSLAGCCSLACLATLYLLGAAAPAGAQETGCIPAPEGLVSWWAAENTAQDIEDGNHGTLEKGAGYAAGKVGNAFAFDGVDDMVLIPDDSSLRPSQVTVDAWVNLDELFGTTHGDAWPFPGCPYIVFKRNSRRGNFEDYALLKCRANDVSGPHVFLFVVASAEGVQTLVRSTTTVETERWYHVAATYDGEMARLYVDGALDAERIHGFPLDHTTNPVVIGRSGQDNEPGEVHFDVAFDGRIDEVEIFDRALEPEEIAAIYEAGSDGKCKDEDGDGFRPPYDCDETDPAINPDAPELPGNFIDENCDGNLGDCDPCFPWRNHGEYVRCVAHSAEALVEAGILSEEEGDSLVSSAAQSEIGKRGFEPPECL